METWEQDCTPAIVQFWENFVSNIHDFLTQSTTDEKVRREKRGEGREGEGRKTLFSLYFSMSTMCCTI